jgi:hypothetical protein
VYITATIEAMATPDAFHELVKESFRFKGEAFKIGAAVLGANPSPGRMCLSLSKL